MKSLQLLLEPKSIAVIGASVRSGAIGNSVIANLHRGGYAGPVLPVHPKHSSVLRIHCYRTVDDLPIVPDLAIVCTPAALAAGYIEQLGKRGTRAAIVMSGDFDGCRPDTPFKSALTAAAKPQGLRWLGPESAGLQVPRLGLNASSIDPMASPGTLALVSQSSSVAASAVAWATARGIGFSKVVTTGNSGDIGICDMLDYLAADEETRAILLYVDELTDGRRFMTAARGAARLKPVVVLKSKPAAAGAAEVQEVDYDAVCDAAFRRSGLLRVNEIGDWFDAVASLGYRRTHGERLAIICNGAGPGQLAAGALADARHLGDLAPETVTRLRALVPKGTPIGNPLDIGRDADARRVEEVMKVLAASGDSDALLVIVTPGTRATSEEMAQATAQAVKSGGRPVFACWLGGAVNSTIQTVLASSQVPLYETPERAARAFLHLVRFRRNQESLKQLPESRRPGPGAESELRLSDEAESTELLRAYGAISRAVLEERSELDEAETVCVLAAHGFQPAQAGIGAGVQIPLEIITANDRAFGRVIRLTIGHLQKVVLPPLNSELAAEALAELQPALARCVAVPLPGEAWKQMLVRFADLIVTFPEIVGACIPFLSWDGNELQPAGTRLWVAAHRRSQRHLAVQPYPREYEELTALRDGRTALIRPLRPDEDIPLFQELLAHTEHDDLFLRFCTNFPADIKGIPPQILASLVRPDYDRQMTFIAVAAGKDGQPEALGVVDAFASADHAEAEFAVLIRSDLKGGGLGKILMHKIIRYCRERQIDTLFGIVLRDNHGMLRLATRLGFATKNEHDMVRVSLALTVLLEPMRASVSGT